MTTIASTSDIHGNLGFHVPKSDILTISGDICSAFDSHSPTFQLHWLKGKFIPWCSELIEKNTVKHVVFIAGNHDFVLDRVRKGDNDAFKIKWPDNVHYLYQSGVEIDGIKIFGTPWTTIFGNFVFMQDERVLNNYFREIPEGLDILLSHSPVYGFNDKPNQENLGSKSLRENVKRAMPKKVIVGHIHSGSHSVERLCLDPFEGKFVDIVNVSLVDDEYNAVYPVYKYVVEK